MHVATALFLPLLLAAAHVHAQTPRGTQSPRPQPSQPAAESPREAPVRPLNLNDLGAPSFEAYTSRDGLPDAVITAIGVDAEGFTWVTSAHGLFRFVGHRWQQRTGPEFGRAHRRLTLDRAGTLWAPSMDGPLARYRDGAWQAVDLPGTLAGAGTYRVSETEAPGGPLRTWLLTMDAGLYEFRDDAWVADPGNADVPRAVLLTTTHTTDLFGGPRQWIGTGDQGLWYRRDGETTWRPYREHGLGPGQVEDLWREVDDDDGEVLWVSVFGGGVWRLSAAGARVWSTRTGELRSNEVYTLSGSRGADGRTTVWVASRAGLVRIRGTTTETFDRSHGLPSDKVRGTMVWRSPAGEEVLWIATEGGVARTILGQHRWRTATLMGSAAIGVFGVRVEPDGRGGERLWAGASRDGLGLYEGGRWRSFSAANGALPDNDIRALRRAPDVAGRDALWLGTGAGHLIRVHEGPRFETIPTPWPSEPNNAVMDVLGRRVDGEHELWVATRLSGVHRLRRSGWTAFELEGVSPDWRPTTLLEQVDRAGRSWLWSTSAHGLARFDGNRWVPLRGVTGLPERSMLGINLWPDDEGRQVLWVGTGFDGLVRLDVSDPLAPRVLAAAELPPPIDPAVYGAVRDSQGRLYLCTNNGVQQLTPVPGGGWRERVFHRRDGMVHEECNTNAQFMDEHDRFWTGTLGGLTVYDPASPASTSSAALRLVDVRVDGETVATDGLRLLPGLRELHAEFTLQTWQREGENRYRTRLLGMDTVPGPWTASAARTFTALPPGSYQLHVEARDHAGNEAQPLVLSFVVVPAWWQTRVARVLLVAAIVMLAALLFHWRTRSLRRQKSLLEAQVQMRTEQLNAANRQLLELSYTDALTGLANRRRMREQLHSLLPADGTAAVRCSMIFIDIDSFKAYNDRLGHPAGDEALRVVANSLQACAPQEALVARYGGEEFACLLPHMEPDRAFELAERMRRHVAEQSIPVPGTDSRERATISAGVATAVLATESDIHRLMREADAALYRAKDEGRNRVRA